ASADIFDTINNYKKHEGKPNDDQGNLLKNVFLGDIGYRLLIGTASVSKAQELLNELNPSLHLKPLEIGPDLKPKPGSGVAMVFFQSYVTNDVIGCGCPTGFSDVFVHIAVQGEGPYAPGQGNGTVQIASTWGVTNHQQRQHSLSEKFG